MNDRAEVVSAIFVLLVGVAMFFLLRASVNEGDVSELSSLIADLALPAMVFLVILFGVLSIIELGR